jgi:hypothetical protein
MEIDCSTQFLSSNVDQAPIWLVRMKLKIQQEQTCLRHFWVYEKSGGVYC